MQTLDRRARQHGVRAVRHDALGAARLEHLGRFGQRAGGIDHVVHDDAVASVDLADDVHHFRDIRLGTAFVDDGQIAVHQFGQRAGAHHTADVGRDHNEVAVILFAQVGEQNRRGVNVVDRNVEKPLHLIGMQVHGDHARHACGLQHIGHDLGGDGHTRGARTPVLPRIAEIGNDRGDALGRSTLERIDHDEQFHQVVIGRRASGLNDEHLAGAHVLLNLDGHFTVGEPPDIGLTEANAELFRNFLGKRRIGIAGEQDEVRRIRCHGGVLRLFSAPEVPELLFSPAEPAVCSAASETLSKIVAGEEGLEPSNAGIKIRCLNQLGDSPTSFTTIDDGE